MQSIGRLAFVGLGLALGLMCSTSACVSFDNDAAVPIGGGSISGPTTTGAGGGGGSGGEAPNQCLPMHSQCGEGSPPCCDGVFCFNDICGSPCFGKPGTGGTCNVSEDCCAELECVEGICTQPNPGVGGAGGG